MKKRIVCIMIALFSVVSVAATHVAVLETVSENGLIGRSEKIFLTDKLRERAKAVLPAYMGYIVMTRENINAMLPPGKSIEECEGSCLVETGKNISADYVAQARVGKFGKQLTLTMELYETSGNNLVGSFTTRKPDAEGLLEEIEREADRFFSQIVGPKAPAAGGKGAPRSENLDVGGGNEEKRAISSRGEVLVDTRDGRKYRTVVIGDQTWMAENLNYKIKDSYCFEDNEAICNKDGRHYEWNAAYQACPEGWKLPSKEDFETLIETIGGKSTAGKKLKSKKGWQKGNGTNEYSFRAVPAGMRYVGDYHYNYHGNEAFFWTSSEAKRSIYHGTAMYGLKLYSTGDDAVLDVFDRFYGFSVRCIKE